MLKRFFPDLFIQSAYRLPLNQLKKRGITGLIFDIDNTLAPFDKKDADERVKSYMRYLKKKGFEVCLLSNNSKNRVLVFNQKLRLKAVYWAGKPFTVGIKRAMKLMRKNKNECVLIGDQIFTDVWCGNRAGVLTILTEPMADRDQLLTKVKRGLERKVLTIYHKSKRTRLM